MRGLEGGIWKSTIFTDGNSPGAYPTLGGQLVDRAILVGRGWLLGEFKWKYLYGSHEGSKVIENCLTALLDLSPNDLIYQAVRDLSDNHGLARVQHYSGDYKILADYPRTGRYQSPYGWDQRFMDWKWETSEGWRVAMQAVKRLTGESS